MTKLTGQEQARLLLQRYKNRQCTPEEEELVRRWFEAMGHDAALPAEDEMDRSVSQLMPRIMQGIQEKKTGPARPRRQVYLLRAAAAVAIFALGTLVYLLIPKATQTFVTAMGERREFLLPDGTSVFLNAASEMRINADFSQQKREVWLSGEGFFTVAQDPGHPFIVHTGSLRTHVLGTSFDIHAYPGGDIRVAVRTGKVSILKENTVLTPGLTGNQSLSYHNRTGQYEIKPCKAEQSAAWKNDELFFDETPLSEIVAALARHYNADLQLTGPVPAGCRYTVSFKQQALPQVLSVLASLSGITYKTEGKKIIINPQTCN
ncbi:FecR family protein [Chitinophaga barathri]|nr:FecR domain-containing protein [Chitinophaga barathri]